MIVRQFDEPNSVKALGLGVLTGQHYFYTSTSTVILFSFAAWGRHGWTPLYT